MKITKLARVNPVKHFIWNKQANCRLFVCDSFLLSWETNKKCSNVVHLHTRMLPVAFSICWWPCQWCSAADWQMLTWCCFRSLMQ